MGWLATESDDGAEAFGQSFWECHAAAIRDGVFWADQIKGLRSEPAKRLQLAMDNFPLPAALREAKIATRAMIRAKRKAKEDHRAELAILYWTAALESFCVPYSEFLKEPGYNTLQSIPAGVFRSLPFSYSELGYKLLGLQETDVKWIVEQWGEPEAHSTLNKLHRDTWHTYELKLLRQRRV